MKTSQNGIDLIGRFEGCHLAAYKCPAGVWTIGYGHVANVYPGLRITQGEAERFLKEDITKFEQKVDKYGRYKWSQNEFDALVSFAFNLGSIDQLTANGTRDRKTIAAKMPEYNKAAGKVLQGLVRRREAERALFVLPAAGEPQEGAGRQAGNPYKEPTTNLKEGSKGEGVRWLQTMLNQCGYELAVDGDFGSNTVDAVLDFQESRGLKADGIVGKLTRTELNK